MDSHNTLSYKGLLVKVTSTYFSMIDNAIQIFFFRIGKNCYSVDLSLACIEIMICLCGAHCAVVANMSLENTFRGDTGGTIFFFQHFLII